MSKEYSYFKFFPNDWLSGEVQAFSFNEKGMFTDLIAYYWKKNCQITKRMVTERFNVGSVSVSDLLAKCISFGIIEVLTSDEIVIKFLNNQYYDKLEQSEVNTVNGRKGGNLKQVDSER